MTIYRLIILFICILLSTWIGVIITVEYSEFVERLSTISSHSKKAIDYANYWVAAINLLTVGASALWLPGICIYMFIKKYKNQSHE